MNKFVVKVVGADVFAAKIGTAVSNARARFRTEVNSIGVILAARVKTNRLRGQSLKQQSGRLVDSIHHEVVEDGNTIRADVGTNVVYAAAHELGFKGTVAVKEHMRTIKQAWGKPISPKQIVVKAHPMKMNMPQRAFLDPEFQVYVPIAHKRLQNTAIELAKEATQ